MANLVAPFTFPLGGNLPIPTPASITGGTANYDPCELMRSWLAPVFAGPNWQALICAVATGDSYIFNTAETAYNMAFLSTAAEQYLDQRAALYGYERPSDVGMADDFFRQLVISAVNNKLTLEAILDVLEIYFGVDTTRAHEQSGLAEPYTLADGQSLTFTLDRVTPYSITFHADEFTNIAAATAFEVSTAINEQLADQGSKAFAAAYYDPQTQNTYVRLFSEAKGLRGAVQITGGLAQNALQFPGNRNCNFNGKTWTVTLTGQTMHWSLGSAPNDLSLVRVGDYVIISGSELGSANIGTYIVTSVVYSVMGNSYFEYTDFFGTTGTFTQTSQASMTFYQSITSSIQEGPRTALVTEFSDALQLEIPVTSQVVNRGQDIAAYLTEPTIGVISNAYDTALNGSVYLILTSSFAPSVGSFIIVDGLLPSYANAGYLFPTGHVDGLFQVVAWNVAFGTQNPGQFAVLQPNRVPTAHSPNVYITSSTTFFTLVTSQTAKPVPGPYIFDPVAGIAVTSTLTSTTASLTAGVPHPFIPVSSVSAFPDSEGWVVIGFGYSYQTAPVKYLGRTSNGIYIDSGYVFPQAVPSGATVILLLSKQPWVPLEIQDVGEFWLTGSPAGRGAALATLNDVVAAGIDITTTVMYPSAVGLGGGLFPSEGPGKVSDVVAVYANGDPTAAQTAAEAGE